MNVKLRQLAEQSGFVDYSVHNRIESKETVLENFAKLIVQECISVIVQNDYHGEWLGDKIKEHFGVE